MKTHAPTPMTFANPAVLLLLLLLIPFTVLAVWNFRKKRQLLREFISPGRGTGRRSRRARA